MRAPRSALLAVFIAFLLPLSGGSRQTLPVLQDDILSRSARISDAPVSPFSAFEGALLLSGVPGGEGFTQGCTDSPAQTVRPHGATLREVLDSITGDKSGYVWKMREGVVNLEPSTGFPALLKTHLKTFQSHDLSDAGSAVTFLTSSPEVERAAAENGLQHNVSGAALSGMTSEPAPPKKPLDIRLHNLMLFEALNAIARANKHGAWVYREVHCGPIRQFDVTFVQ